MMAILISAWVVGGTLLLAALVYFFIDYQRTGDLFRKKLPMMMIGLVGGLLAVLATFIGVAASKG